MYTVLCPLSIRGVQTASCCWIVFWKVPPPPLGSPKFEVSQGGREGGKEDCRVDGKHLSSSSQVNCWPHIYHPSVVPSSRKWAVKKRSKKVADFVGILKAIPGWRSTRGSGPSIPPAPKRRLCQPKMWLLPKRRFVLFLLSLSEETMKG